LRYTFEFELLLLRGLGRLGRRRLRLLLLRLLLLLLAYLLAARVDALL